MLDGMPLLQWVVDRVRPQVDVLAVSGGNRAGFSLPIIADQVSNAGPLSALCSILAWAEQKNLPLVMTFSCDTPFIPHDIVDGLRRVLRDRDCAIASRADAAHPTCALWKTKAREKIETAFAAGVRSLREAVAGVNACQVDFAAVRDGPGGDPFFNINSRSDMVLAQAWLERRRQSG